MGHSQPSIIVCAFWLFTSWRAWLSRRYYPSRHSTLFHYSRWQGEWNSWLVLDSFRCSHSHSNRANVGVCEIPARSRGQHGFSWQAQWLHSFSGTTGQMLVLIIDTPHCISSIFVALAPSHCNVALFLIHRLLSDQSSRTRSFSIIRASWRRPCFQSDARAVVILFLIQYRAHRASQAPAGLDSDLTFDCTAWWIARWLQLGCLRDRRGLFNSREWI